MQKLDLTKSEIPAERENFKKLDQEFSSNPFLAGEWKHFALDFNSAASLKLQHHLGYSPTDYIITFNTAGGSLSSFTADSVTITTTGAGSVRFLLGRIK